MSDLNRREVGAWERFLDVYFDELSAMSDDDVLSLLDRSFDVTAERLAIVANAKAEAGRRRLAAARARLAEKSNDPTPNLSVTPSEARQFLAEAMNDRRFTLAARQLSEISDEDAVRLYLQLKELQNSDD